MSNNLKKITLGISLLFGILWTALIGLDYGNKHPGYYFSFSYFRYLGLYFSVTLFIIGSYFFYNINVTNNRPLKIRGLHVLLLIPLLFALIIFCNRNFGELDSSFGDLSQFWINATFNFSLLLIFFHVLRSFGQLLRVKILKDNVGNSFTIDTAIGVMAFTSILFILGVFDCLWVSSILLVIFFLIVINITYFITKLKVYLIEPINLKDVNFLGWACFIFMLFFLSINFLSTNIPYPAGFDSRNVYVNISKIIADTGGLVSGFQPYNWSLLMSVGFIMFDYVELALGISFSAIVIVLIGTNELGVKYLKINGNIMKFILTLFVVTPSLVNQMFVEIKVDFGLLFFQIASLIVFFYWKENYQNTLNRASFCLVVLLGFLCGFGLGIKLINLFLIFVLIALIWWNTNNKVGLLGILLLSISVLILAGIDELSGLQIYHLGYRQTAITCAIVAFILLFYSFIMNRDVFLRNTLFSIIMSVSMMLMFSPWLCKNYLESEKISVNKLILGNGSGPDIGSYYDMLKRYKESQND